MKKMNFASITAGLDTLKDVMQQNAEIAQDISELTRCKNTC